MTICILIQVARRHAEARRTRVIDGLLRGSRYIVRCGVLRIPHIIIRGVAGAFGAVVVIVRRRVLDVVANRGLGAGRVGESRHRAVFDVIHRMVGVACSRARDEGILAAPLVEGRIALLAFAAGAMLYVVVEELIPETAEGSHSNLGTVGFALGFALMMALDVLLG